MNVQVKAAKVESYELDSFEDLKKLKRVIRNIVEHRQSVLRVLSK